MEIRHYFKGNASAIVLSLCALVISLSVAAFLAVAWLERARLFAEAEQLAADANHILAEHAERFFLTNDLMLKRAVDLVRDPDWSMIDASGEKGRRLREIAADLPFDSSIWIFDQAANSRLTSLEFPAPPISAFGRNYFHMQEAGRRGLYVGELHVSRRTDEIVFTMSRRISNANGGFAGVAMVAAPPSYLGDFYDTVRLKYPALIEVVRQDLSVLVRRPDVDDETALSLRKEEGPFVEAIAVSDAGVYRATSPADGVDRVSSYRRIGHLPLFVSVGIPTGAIAEEWRSRIMSYGFFGGAALAALLVLSWLALRATSALRRSHETLEWRVAERTKDLQEHAEALKVLVNEKEILVREVHHRVKNNLQVVSMLLQMEARRRDASDRYGYMESLRRVQAMGLVHQLLYRSEALEKVDFCEYLEELGETMLDAHGASSRVTLHFDCAASFFDLDTATPLALLVNEVLSNALKHAYPEGQAGDIHVTLRRTKNDIVLRISDDGIGMDADQSGANTLGLTLVQALASQLGATYAFGQDGGTAFELRLHADADAPPTGHRRDDAVVEAACV